MTADGAGAALDKVVSVRFGTEGLRRIRALAVIYDTTPNAVIREACRFYLSHQAGTSGYRQVVEDHLRAAEVADVPGQDQELR